MSFPSLTIDERNFARTPKISCELNGKISRRKMVGAAGFEPTTP